MTLVEALDRLETLLEDERQAVRAIDSKRVSELADEKGALLDTLKTADWSNDRDSIVRFRALVPRLRESTVLLAHARNAAKGLVTALTQSRPTSYGADGSFVAETKGARLAMDV